ncbi:hypothetical protein BMS3Bbin05_00059 [bacterium BMS3Bbin05]|nr:hypothetical protein BMS3Bbin05_00059 [bacterium BMS3Bbin05]
MTGCTTAFLWDESHLWGLMAYRALAANCLPFELVKSVDIREGVLDEYRMLFVPGGWSSNKMKALGEKGVAAVRAFVENGGSYIGFCGGAGLATLDGMGLLNIKRRPSKDGVPGFSGRIRLELSAHDIWNGIDLPVFHAWWPPQFVIEDSKVRVLARYGEALSDAFSSDLNVGDIRDNGSWTDLEKIYGINLDPCRLAGEPAVVEGHYGGGRVVLSLLHFDTPDDTNGAVVLKNIWRYLGSRETGDVTPPSTPSREWTKGVDAFTGLGRKDDTAENVRDAFAVVADLEYAVTEIIDIGIRNFLWFRRNPMLLQWRRGVRGLEYGTLYVLIKEISARVRQLCKTDSPGKIGDDMGARLKSIRHILIPFSEKAKRLLTLERFAIRNGQITYEKCDNTEIQEIRSGLFAGSKSYGGTFKKIIDMLDDILFRLLNMEIRE